MTEQVSLDYKPSPVYYNEKTLFEADLTSPLDEPDTPDHWRGYPPQNRRAYAIVTHEEFCKRATEEHVRLAIRIFDWINLSDKAGKTREEFFKESDRVLDSNEWIELMIKKTHSFEFDDYVNK